MVLVEPEHTMNALPNLLSKPDEKKRVLQLMKRALSLDGITNEQRDMGNRIVKILKNSPANPDRAVHGEKKNRKTWWKEV